MSLDFMVWAFLITFGPLLPYFYGSVVAGSVLAAFVSFGIDVGRFSGRPADK